MLHLAKLSVGTSDTADLRAWQQRRSIEAPPLRHLTRQMPRRAAEILGGGSIYWVIQGVMLVRQRILAISAARRDDGSACAALVLDPALVATEARPTRPFQGWRYLSPDAAPADLRELPATEGEAALPAAMLRDLRALRLI